MRIPLVLNLHVKDIGIALAHQREPASRSEVRYIAARGSEVDPIAGVHKAGHGHERPLNVRQLERGVTPSVLPVAESN